MSPQPQMSLEVDLLRPMVSMPPVILMDGGSFFDHGSRLSINSVPASPIIEMPPSPAPLQRQVVEFPGRNEVYEFDEDGCIVEVSY